MKITKGETKHIESIANLLVDHFTRLNSRFGYNRYKTDPSRMTEIVSERINDSNSLYKYVILESDEGDFAGFINLLFAKDISEILLLELLPEYNTYENAKILLHSAVTEFKRLGTKRLLTQISPEEPNYKKAFEELSSEVLLWTAIYNL